MPHRTKKKRKKAFETEQIARVASARKRRKAKAVRLSKTESAK